MVARFAPSLLIFSIVRRPRRTVRVFVISRAGAASAHRNLSADSIDRVNFAMHYLPISPAIRAPKFSTVFHSLIPC